MSQRWLLSFFATSKQLFACMCLAHVQSSHSNMAPFVHVEAVLKGRRLANSLGIEFVAAMAGGVGAIQWLAEQSQDWWWSGPAATELKHVTDVENILNDSTTVLLLRLLHILWLQPVYKSFVVVDRSALKLPCGVVIAKNQQLDEIWNIRICWMIAMTKMIVKLPSHYYHHE